jgi:hypothetical protein
MLTAQSFHGYELQERAVLEYINPSQRAQFLCWSNKTIRIKDYTALHPLLAAPIVTTGRELFKEIGNLSTFEFDTYQRTVGLALSLTEMVLSTKIVNLSFSPELLAAHRVLQALLPDAPPKLLELAPQQIPSNLYFIPIGYPIKTIEPLQPFYIWQSICNQLVFKGAVKERSIENFNQSCNLDNSSIGVHSPWWEMLTADYLQGYDVLVLYSTVAGLPIELLSHIKEVVNLFINHSNNGHGLVIAIGASAELLPNNAPSIHLSSTITLSSGEKISVSRCKEIFDRHQTQTTQSRIISHEQIEIFNHLIEDLITPRAGIPNRPDLYRA